MAVSQITAPGRFFEWAPRDTFLPLVTAGQRPVCLDDAQALLALTRPDFDPRTSVFLPPETKPWVSVTNQTTARIISKRFTAQRLEVEIEAEKPALVVLSQTYYHPWRAYLDGQPTRLLRANYAFQAVETPAGHHRVRLVYEDHALYLGTFISGLSLAVCLGLWMLARNRRQGGR